VPIGSWVSCRRESDRRGRESIGRVGVGEFEETSIGDSGGRAIEGFDDYSTGQARAGRLSIGYSGPLYDW
jgi:hypothetical protein